MLGMIARHHRRCCEPLNGYAEQQQPDEDGFKQDFHEKNIRTWNHSPVKTDSIWQ